MFYVKKLPLWERYLRIGAGTAMAVYALLGVGGMIGWFIFACGPGAAATGVFGFFPACALAGRRLEKRLHQQHK